MNNSKKRKPEVVVFQEPARKQRRNDLKNKSVSRNDERDQQMSSVNFKEIAREVREFGISGFAKKDQRKMKQREAEALGAKAPKKRKMPYPLLMELKKIWNQKEEKQKEMETNMGVFTKKKKRNYKEKQFPQGTGRWIDRSQSLDEGRMKKGIRKMKQQDIVRINKTKRK